MCVLVRVHVCVCYHLISEAVIFHYQEKLLMDGMGWERLELQSFFHKNMLLRKYGSFNNLVVLRHLVLLTSAERAN